MRAKQVKSLLSDVEAALGEKIKTLGAYIMGLSKKSKFNPQELEDLGGEYLTLLRTMDITQHAMRYEWSGLPDNLTGAMIENMLYYRFSLAGTILAGTLYALPWTTKGEINAYGYPTAVSLITYNGSIAGKSINNLSALETLYKYDGEINPNAKVAILTDRPPEFAPSGLGAPRASIAKKLIDDIAETLGRVRIIQQNGCAKIVFYVDDPQQADLLDKDLSDAYGSSKPYIILTKQPGNNVPPEKFQGEYTADAQATFETFQSLNSIRCMSLGIPNNGAFEKKERKITGELDSDAQTRAALEGGLQRRKQWIHELQIIYGSSYPEIVNNIDVKICDYLEEKSMTNYNVQPIDNNQGGNNV